MSKTKIIAVILVIVFALSLCGCGDTVSVGAKVVATSSDGYVVIEALSTGGSLQDALNALAEAGELKYGGYEGEYGFYLTSVNGREADASANEYWAVYTSLGEYDGVVYSNAEYGTFNNYDNKTLASASYGVSGLLMVEGELYVIVLESY